MALLVLLARAARARIVTTNFARRCPRASSLWRHKLHHPIVKLPHLGRAKEVPLFVLLFVVGLHLVGPRLTRHEDEVFSNRSARELGCVDADPDNLYEVRKFVFRRAACVTSFVI